MAKVKQPTGEQLRTLLDYDPDTGNLTWKTRGPEWFTGSLSYQRIRAAQWNTKYAGKLALNSANTQMNYYFGSVLGCSQVAHRVIWCMLYDVWPEIVDHIDGNGRNNRRANLREVNHTTNMRNQPRRLDNTTGVTGVWYEKRRKHWVAEIMIDGKKRHIGSFATRDEAAAARVPYEQANGFTSNHGKRETIMRRAKPVVSPDPCTQQQYDQRLLI